MRLCAGVHPTNTNFGAETARLLLVIFGLTWRFCNAPFSQRVVKIMCMEIAQIVFCKRLSNTRYKSKIQHGFCACPYIHLRYTPRHVATKAGTCMYTFVIRLHLVWKVGHVVGYCLFLLPYVCRRPKGPLPLSIVWPVARSVRNGSRFSFFSPKRESFEIIE